MTWPDKFGQLPSTQEVCNHQPQPLSWILTQVRWFTGTLVHHFLMSFGFLKKSYYSLLQYLISLVAWHAHSNMSVESKILSVGLYCFSMLFFVVFFFFNFNITSFLMFLICNIQIRRIGIKMILISSIFFTMEEPENLWIQFYLKF